MTATTTTTTATEAIADIICSGRWARVFIQNWPAATTAQKNYLRRLLAQHHDAKLVSELRDHFNGYRETGDSILGPEVSAAITLLTR